MRLVQLGSSAGDSGVKREACLCTSHVLLEEVSNGFWVYRDPCNLGRWNRYQSLLTGGAALRQEKLFRFKSDRQLNYDLNPSVLSSRSEPCRCVAGCYAVAS